SEAKEWQKKRWIRCFCDEIKCQIFESIRKQGQAFYNWYMVHTRNLSVLKIIVISHKTGLIEVFSVIWLRKNIHSLVVVLDDNRTVTNLRCNDPYRRDNRYEQRRSKVFKGRCLFIVWKFCAF